LLCALLNVVAKSLDSLGSDISHSEPFHILLWEHL
jgi:hypothetical protein